MSLTYAEIYQNKIKNKNKIKSEEKSDNSRNQKIISLIKKFPLKQRKTFKNTEKNFKPRRIQSKSVQAIQKYRKTSDKKKTISKQKMENNENNKKEKSNINEINNARKPKNKKRINDNNKLEINNFYKTEINKENIPENIKSNNNNKKGHKIKPNKTYNKTDSLQENKNIIEFENFNKVNKFDTINKNMNSSIDTYFEIFKLRQNAANFKDKVKNNIYLTKYNSNNDLYKLFNLDENNKNNTRQLNVKNFSDFASKKSKTYYKAIKLKEQLEYNIKNYNMNKQHMYSSCNNFYVKNKIDSKNGNDEKNKKGITIEMEKQFFNEKEKRPKVMKKFLTYNGNIKYGNKEEKNKNNIRTRKFGLFCQDNENKKIDENINNNLISKFSSELYQLKNKRKAKYNNRSLNLIVQDNPKLNNLLRKIPSSKEKREKSYDLIDFILHLRNKGDKTKYYANTKYNSDNINLGIYPANEWEYFNRFKHENAKI